MSLADEMVHGCQESWYEKLCRWDEALRAYDAKREENPPGSLPHLEATMGRLRYSYSHLALDPHLPQTSRCINLYTCQIGRARLMHSSEMMIKDHAVLKDGCCNFSDARLRISASPKKFWIV